MPNKNYQRGFSAEKRCQEDLEKMGYWSSRSYGSKGCFDVIAVAQNQPVRLIEVKRSKKYVLKQQSIENKYEMSLTNLNMIPDGGAIKKELWVWFDKQGKVGDKKYQPAHWEKFAVTRVMIVRMKES
jgi:hypothetical protein